MSNAGRMGIALENPDGYSDAEQMAAFDRLPPDVRALLQNARGNWCAVTLLRLHAEGFDAPRYFEAFDRRMWEQSEARA